MRYWGSHFKSRRHATTYASELRPLLEQGERCCLVMQRPPGDPTWLLPLAESGVQFHYEQRPRGNLDARNVWRVFRLCRSVGCQVFHCENLHTSPLIGAYLARVPVRLWTKQSMNSCYEECRTPTWRDRWAPSVRLSCRLASRVIAVSQQVKAELVQLGVSPARVLVRHNPRQLGALLPAGERAALRTELGLSDDEVVFVTVGQALPVKGWDVLVRAFVQVAEVFPQVRLILAGSFSGAREQPLYAGLVEHLRERRQTDRVRFTGHLEDIRPVLQAADVYVSPSRSEGFSNALIEGLEAGLPCVATRVGIAEEVIRDGVNGLLVERAEEAALARALERLARDRDIRTKFARNAVVPPCIPTLEQYGQQLAEDYESLLLRTT